MVACSMGIDLSSYEFRVKYSLPFHLPDNTAKIISLYAFDEMGRHMKWDYNNKRVNSTVTLMPLSKH